MLAACGNDATNDSVLEAAPSESQMEEATTSEVESPAAELVTIEPKFDLDAGTVTLNNGVSMPILGIGTFALSDSEAEESVYWALRDGCRLIDTARIYGDEAGVGRGIRCAIEVQTDSSNSAAEILRRGPDRTGDSRKHIKHKSAGGEGLLLTACGFQKWSGFSAVCGIIVVKRKITADLAVIFLEMVDPKGFEPSTSRMRTERSPN